MPGNEVLPIDEEHQLTARLAAGDDAAYEELVRAFGGRMLAVATRLLKNESDARDAVQDAFLSAFRSIDRFEGKSRLSTWLHRVTVNAALMKLRTKRRRPEKEIDALLPDFQDDGHFHTEPRAWDLGPMDVAALNELRARVRDYIDELPDSYRSVILLRDIAQLDTRETAKILNITENAVKIRLHRARLALRTLLDPSLRGDRRMITCRELVEFLDDYTSDSLADEKRAVFEMHLEKCPPCVSYVESYRTTVRLVQATGEPGDAVDHPTDLGEIPERLIQAILDARRAEGSPPSGPGDS